MSDIVLLGFMVFIWTMYCTSGVVLILRKMTIWYMVCCSKVGMVRPTKALWMVDHAQVQEPRGKKKALCNPQFHPPNRIGWKDLFLINHSKKKIYFLLIAVLLKLSSFWASSINSIVFPWEFHFSLQCSK